MKKTEEKVEMLTAAKVADRIGVSASKVKKAIEALAIAPDLVKGGCNYYGAGTVEKIRKSLG